MLNKFSKLFFIAPVVIVCLLNFSSSSNADDVVVNIQSIPPYILRMMHDAPDIDRFVLFEEEISYLTSIAEKGDKSAASRLYLYYKRAKQDYDAADRFLDIVSGGNIGIDQYGLGFYVINFSEFGKRFVIGTTNEDFVLSKRQLAKLMELAKKGNQKAAYRLYQYYINYEGGNVERAISVLLPAAHAGDAKSQALVAGLYFTKGVLKDAKEWALQAKEGFQRLPHNEQNDANVKNVQSFLEKISRMEQ